MSQFLKLLKRWGMPLARRAGAALPLLLGLVTLLLLVAIWWLGPHWHWRDHQPLAGVAHRSVATLLLILLPLSCWLLVLRKRFHRLQAERRQQAAVEADPCLSFVLAQEKALDSAFASYLDNAGGRRARYRLPWYLVLGEQGAGKSSFIDHSNQCFSLTRIASSQARLRQSDLGAYPIGWWVGNDAVIIDPPGAFTLQEATAGALHDDARVPDGLQSRLWNHLLDWLERNRSRRALDGVLLVVDLPALINATPEQRMVLAHGLRTRVHEVSSQLGCRLPLYVVLSKFDLLQGFDQCFARLSHEQRERMLGFTFKQEAVDTFDAWLDEFAEYHDRLTHALYEQTLASLGSPSQARQRERLIALHGQLVGLRPVLTGFLRETLASDRYTTPALVRGVYWCSVLQQGEIDNAFVREAAQPYVEEFPVREGRAPGKHSVYFAQQVFQRVLYREAGLAGDNARVARQKRQMAWAGAGLGVLTIAVCAATWQRYFDINQAKAVNVLAKSREFRHQEVDSRLDPTARNLLQPLDQIRDAVSVFGDYRNVWPLVADLGLYQGRVIGPMVDEAYLRLLSRRFLPALASGVVDAMRTAPVGSEQQMAALRVYRMIEDRKSRRPAWVEDWMARQWQMAYPGQGQLQRDLMRHLEYALAYADADLSPYRRQASEVQQALRAMPMPQRVYASLKQQAHEQLHAGLDIRSQVGPAFDMVYQPVAGATQDDDATWLAPLLTARGFKEFFEPRSQHLAEMAMIDQWALGERAQLDYSDADRQVLTERVRTLYGADYIASWRRALNAFTVADFQDLNHAVSILEQLTGPAAPLHRLLETVRENTAIHPAPSADLALDVSAQAQSAVGTPEQQQAAGIYRAFAGLNGMLDAKGDKPSYYDETLGAISAVHDYAKGVQDSPERGKAALHTVLQRFAMTGADPIGTLQRVAGGLPEPVRQQVRKVADQTAQVLNVEALRELERRWDTEVYSFFQQRLAGRYPFVARGADASLDDFEAFFGPKGRLQQFQDQYLKIFLKDNLDALRSEQHGGSLIRPEVIEQLAAAERIRETFFDQRGNLSVQLSIEPLGLSANQRTSLLDLDGQLISYTHGPRQIIGIVWPNTLGQQVRSNLTLLKLNGNSSSLEYRGPWSMFRLLSRGALNGRTASSVDLSFRTGEGVMRYRLNSEKAFNPITQQPFKGFSLPRGLLRPLVASGEQAI
ncbi:type VI secretion system membrane subunit TssM [Pseudomonas sp. GD03858]|uniref:type VI secretion system membrane subunit TssM n=1 Tax=unclassified Pseudomonas TaxID=196821 RepID=UPI00244D6B9E|nr:MULTISPECIES: type VI secretion system membrane subunit TssM [unclassified Pseudomonas]MDH0648578.1 type VI secretion system membrane subunit TssM [Pseudomonas sp. GD03867]MDH0665162.1 type VI secretion system membrane subunit TssM [Pseudomonas sp. GD03858]